jgi:transposase
MDQPRFFIAIPISWYAMSKNVSSRLRLQDNDELVDIPFWQSRSGNHHADASWQSFRATTNNPIDSLKRDE